MQYSVITRFDFIVKCQLINFVLIVFWNRYLLT